MVRYSFALAGEPKDPQHEIIMEEEMVDIMHGGQLDEHYLCDVNAAGEVPVIVNLETKEIIPDSQEITKYLAESYPSMMPAPHANEIKQMIAALHGISFFAWTFEGKPQSQHGAVAKLEKLLEGDISDRYRKAIEYKIRRINDKKLTALTDEEVARNKDYTKQTVAQLEDLLSKSDTGYFFGLPQPSALDAHVVVFIARMFDRGRAEVIPESLKKYAEKAFTGKAWNDVMQGRGTLPPIA